MPQNITWALFEHLKGQDSVLWRDIVDLQVAADAYI